MVEKANGSTGRLPLKAVEYCKEWLTWVPRVTELSGWIAYSHKHGWRDQNV